MTMAGFRPSEADHDSDEGYRLDRSVLEVRALDDPDDDGSYWLKQSPEERMRALEYLRRRAYGPAATARLQRVFSVAQLGEL